MWVVLCLTYQHLGQFRYTKWIFISMWLEFGNI